MKLAMKRHQAVILALAFASMLGARAITYFALDDLAHVMDEMDYVFQAKVFAAGHVLAPIAEPRAAFNMWFIEDRHARFSIFPPGWPAVLAIALRLGLLHWIDPLLHGITVVLVGRAGERLGGARLAVLAAAIYATSPQSVLMAASLMSHTLVALAAVVILLVCIGLMKEGEAPLSLAAAGGIALGLTAATRPLCAIILGAALALATVLFARHDLRKTALTALVVGLGAAPFVLGLLAFNRATTGALLRFPQMVYFDEHLAPANLPYFNYRKGCNDLGFGPSHGCDLTAMGARHGLANAASNLGDNLTAWLRLVCGPALVVGSALALVRKGTRRTAAFLVAIPLASFALYSLYWHGGTCLGARFYHAALPAAVLLVALGIDFDRRRITLAIVAAVLAWNTFAFTRVMREITDPRWGYWGVDDRFEKVRKGWKQGKAVVMVAFGGDDIHNPQMGWTAFVPTGGMWMLNIRAQAALDQNPPVLDDAEVVFAKFHPGLVAELQKRFPDRTFFLYVANGDRSRDALTPWDPTRFDAAAYRRPVENFDGFRVEPPRFEQPWIFVQEPDRP